MKNFKKNLLKLAVTGGLLALLVPVGKMPGSNIWGSKMQVKAAENAEAEETPASVPTAEDNLSIGLRNTSELVATKEGYMRVFYDGEKIRIEYYDNSFNLLSKKSLKMELPIWGGFYASGDTYYVVEGTYNESEVDTNEVIRVIKYNSNWQRIGAAKVTGNNKLFGGEVRYPFDYGCVEFAEKDGVLYIVTAHEGYVDPQYNQGHQGFLMIAVDEKTMTGEIVSSDLGHSFAQYIDKKGNDLYVLEQSEGSRCTILSKYDGSKDTYSDSLNCEIINVLEYGGSRTSAWAIECYASVDDMAVSSKNVLCLGTSIDQSNYDNVSEKTAHNIYLTVTPISNFTEEATSVKWLTNHVDDGACFLGVALTKISDDRFLLSWEEYGKKQKVDINDGLATSVLHYVFIDGAGNKISKEFTAAAPISDCEPIVKGSKIVYYASNSTMVNFYTIDSNTGKFSKKVYRVAGENATWKIKNSVLTIEGKGSIAIDAEADMRYPLSSTTGVFSYSSSDNIWSDIRNKVSKLVIKTGITSIPDRAFACFDNLKEVKIGSGLKSIGKEAFYGCDSMERVVIPSSVKTIGDDILWTGYYWVGSGGHVTQGAICAPYNSYAIEYAKKNGIPYKMDLSKAKVRGIKESYAYNGKAQKPKVVISLGGKKLVKDMEYTVTYRNNKKTGKATVIITGMGNYYGKITKSFVIVPKKATITKITSPKRRTVSVKWKRDSQADGYQLQYALNKKFTKGVKTVTISKNKTYTKIIKKLKSGKKYYVRIRSYKKISGKSRRGAWSKTMSIKCK